MRPLFACDSVKQGPGAEREQIEQRRPGVLLDEPRQQVGQFRGQFRDSSRALRRWRSTRD
jgi:hypothetical protein